MDLAGDVRTNLSRIETIEQRLTWPGRFGSLDALALGSAIVQAASGRETQKDGSEVGVAVRITREADETVVFEYLADDKTKRHHRYLDGKRAAALMSGHASLWAELALESNVLCPEPFDSSSPMLLGAGAFLVRDDQGLAATIAVSGLHNGLDHDVIVEALERVLADKLKLA